MKYRCPICNGTGAVEPSFGSGAVDVPGTSHASITSAKVCPGCNGTGMQEEHPTSYPPTVIIKKPCRKPYDPWDKFKIQYNDPLEHLPRGYK